MAGKVAARGPSAGAPAIARPSADVAVVIVTHNASADLPGVIASLGPLTAGMRVVVADSGSSDAIEDVCRDLGVGFVPGPNRGYGAAINRAVASAATGNARYLLCMNPDLRIVAGDVASLVRLCDESPQYGVVGPRQLDQHGQLVPSMGVEPTPAEYWRAARSLSSDWIWDMREYAHDRVCDWVMGAFLLIRRSAFDAVGGFDERYFLFSDEIDLCTAIRRAGWHVAYTTRLTIEHRFADRPVDPRREQLLMWAQLVYMRKWSGPWGRASMRAALIARLARQLYRRRRAGLDATGERARLGAALRFSSEGYGPCA